MCPLLAPESEGLSALCYTLLLWQDVTVSATTNSGLLTRMAAGGGVVALCHFGAQVCAARHAPPVV